MTARRGGGGGIFMAACADEHWHDADFAVLKIDLHNAFNQVSRQAVLDA